MAEPWIRVHAMLKQKPVIGRAADALDVSWHEAIGYMVCFWGGVAMYARNGDLSDISDRQIETWADWPGLGYRGRKRKSGQFAAFIRSQHLDADGRVREWDRYAGRLEDRRERDESPDRKSTYVYYAVDGDRCKIGFSGNPWSRVYELKTGSPSLQLAAVERGTRSLEYERHKQFAAISIGREWFRLTPELTAHIAIVAESSPHRSTSRSNDDSDERSNASSTTNGSVASRAPARDARARHETLRDERTTQSISQSAREAVNPVAVFDEHAAMLETPAARQALRTVVDSASSPGACLTALRAMATGNDPAVPKPTPTQLGVALIDFAGNGERWNAAHFRGYVRRAIAGAAPDTTPGATEATHNAMHNGRMPGPSRDRARTADRRFAGDRNDAVLDEWAREEGQGEADVTLELPELDPEPDIEEVHHGE